MFDPANRDLVTRMLQFQGEVVNAFVQAELRYIKLLGLMQPEVIHREEHADGEGVRILVVDDEPAMRQLLEEILAKPGRQIVQASEGNAALAAFKERFFDLVITDKNMPGMNGVDLMRQVKDLRPETAVVMMTAFSTKESAVEAVNLGAEAYLEKPFSDLDKVSALVEKVLTMQHTLKTNVSYLQAIRERHRELLLRHNELAAEAGRVIGSKSGS